MTKMIVRYETGVKADFYTIRRALDSNVHEPVSQVIGKNDSVFECRYDETKFVSLPTEERLRDIFKRAGLPVQSLEIIGRKGVALSH